MKFIKRFIGRLIIKNRLRCHRKSILYMMTSVFMFARESRDSGYDIEWVKRQLEQGCKDVVLSDELKSAIYVSIKYGFSTNMCVDDFY